METGQYGITKLERLSDVGITNPATGEVIKYNSITKKWENGTDTDNKVSLNNTLLVSKNGVDATAARNDWTKPYLTIAAANAAALAGDTVIVMPGTYDEKNIAKTGINYFYFNGAIVHYTGAADGALIDDTITGQNGTITCIIDGHGEFIRKGSGNATSYKAGIFSGAASNITLRCKKLESNLTTIYHAGTGIIKVYADEVKSDTDVPLYTEVAGATLEVKCRAITTTTNAIYTFAGTIIAEFETTTTAVNGSTVYVVGGSTFIKCRKITNTNINSLAYAVRAAGGTLELYADYLSSVGGPAFYSNGAKSSVYVREIYSSANRAVNSNAGVCSIFNAYIHSLTGSPVQVAAGDVATKCYLTGCKIKAEENAAGGHGINISTTDNGLVLADCTIIVTDTVTPANSIYTANLARAYKITRDCAANTAAHANTSNSIVGTSLIVDAGVE